MNPTKLNYHLLSQNKSKLTVFLHGFLGNLRNLKPIANHSKFKEHSDSLLIDVTNHGHSYHKSPITFSDMSSDVKQTMIDLDIFSKYNDGKIASFAVSN